MQSILRFIFICKNVQPCNVVINFTLLPVSHLLQRPPTCVSFLRLSDNKFYSFLQCYGCQTNKRVACQFESLLLGVAIVREILFSIFTVHLLLCRAIKSYRSTQHPHFLYLYRCNKIVEKDNSLVNRTCQNDM